MFAASVSIMEPQAPVSVADPDRELMERFRSGDRTAFDQLVRRHQKQSWRLTRRYVKRDADAADVTQQAFVRAFKGSSAFRGTSSVRSWLSRIAINCALSWLRDHNREQPSESADDALSATNKLIDEAIANQKAFWDLEDKRLAELRKILSPAQTARLVVVLPQFERRIQNQLRKAILNQRTGGRGGRGGRAGGRGSDDDEDDDAGGDLVGDPFGSRGGSRRAPDPTPAPMRGTQKACDPFSTVHGCSSK